MLREHKWVVVTKDRTQIMRGVTGRRDFMPMNKATKSLALFRGEKLANSVMGNYRIDNVNCSPMEVVRVCLTLEEDPV